MKSYQSLHGKTVKESDICTVDDLTIAFGYLPVTMMADLLNACAYSVCTFSKK
jgi:hypothetical protein